MYYLGRGVKLIIRDLMMKTDDDRKTIKLVVFLSVFVCSADSAVDIACYYFKSMSFLP